MYINSFNLFLSFLLFHSCTPNEDWWKNGIIYQVYPRSFKDSNNDGNGDLPGVIDKLPYLKSTGVDCVWLSPIMKSPQVDGGYDISDFYAIDEMYGKIDDLKELIRRAHDLGLKIMLDFVPNHTSDQHRWFKESEKGNAKYKDYYVWKNAKKKGSPPNNWVSCVVVDENDLSVFGGSAWQWSKKRKQYYLHQFAKEQPDLNYRNPAVCEEMKKVLVHYMDFGVDGFRIDAVMFLFEDEQFRDEPRSSDPGATPTNHAYLDHIHTTNLPETFAVISDWRQLVDEYSETQGGPSRILVTEVYSDMNHILQYYGTPDRLGVHFSFNFFFITDLKQNISRAYDVARIVYTWQNALPTGNVSNWVLGNHDNHRIPTRYGAKNIDGFNMLLLLLPGVAVTYNGEEFGQDDGEVTFEQRKDPSARDKATFHLLSRDFERTPLQWDDTTNGGFNEGAKPWLPVSQNYKELNLASQLNEKKLSHYQIYRRLVRLRKDEPVRKGTTDIWAISDDVIILKRSAGGRHIILAFKMGWNGNDEKEDVYIPSVREKEATLLLKNVGSSYKIGSTINPQKFTLGPHESLVLEIVTS